jgi:hypothetical protein
LFPTTAELKPATKVHVPNLIIKLKHLTNTFDSFSQ